MTAKILELVPLVRRYVPNDREWLRLLVNGRTEPLALYDLAWEEQVKSPQQLAVQSNLSEVQYKKAERQLLQALRKMISLVVFPDDESDPFMAAFIDGYQKIGMLKVMRLLGARFNAEDVARDLLRAGEKYENPILTFFAADALCDLTANTQGDERGFHRWRELGASAKQAIDIEQRMRGYFQQTQLTYLHSRQARPEMAALIGEQLGSMTPYFGAVRSNNFELHYLLAHINKHMADLDYVGALQATEFGIRHFMAKPYLMESVVSALQLQKITCCIMLRRFEEGRSAAEYALAHTPENLPNWYQTLIAYFYLAMHTREYERAADIYKRGLANRRLRFQPEHLLSLWRLLGAYLYIALRYAGKKPESYGLPAVRSSKLLNDVPAFTQDKRGLNVAILIAHILIQLLEGKYDDIRQRTGALEKYGSRYLRNDDHLLRSNTFIKILGILPKVNFRRRFFLEKAKPILQKLNVTPIEIARQTHEIEIVPYEDLWEMLINHLDERAR